MNYPQKSHPCKPSFFPYPLSGNKVEDLSGTFSASLRVSMGVADGGGGVGGVGGVKRVQGVDGGAAATGLNTPDVSTSAIESKSNLNRM